MLSDPLITTRELSVLLDVSPGCIRQRLHRGDLPPPLSDKKNIGAIWLRSDLIRAGILPRDSEGGK